MLQNLPPDHPARGNNEKILKAAGRARDLVRQIPAFSRQTVQERRIIHI